MATKTLRHKGFLWINSAHSEPPCALCGKKLMVNMDHAKMQRRKFLKVLLFLFPISGKVVVH